MIDAVHRSRAALGDACEASAVVVVVMVALARFHPPPPAAQAMPWERELADLPATSHAVVRAAFAALPELERGVVRGAPPSVPALVDDAVAPFTDPRFSFAFAQDGDIAAWVGRGADDAPLRALLLHVQPTTAPPSGAQDEDHHLVVDDDGRPHWLHASVWVVPPGAPLPSDGVDAPVSLGYLRVRAAGGAR